MNSYFTNIGKELSDNLNCTFDESDMSYISRVTPTCNDIVYNEKKLDDQLRDLNPRKAAGHDDIGSMELKVIGDPVKPGIRCIVQKSIAEKKFPDTWKLAKLKSIFKKGEEWNRENYRPISLLCILSKLMEGQMCHQMDSHLTISGISHPNQWGFKHGCSTEGILLYLTEEWKAALDDGSYVGILFVDFKKAFDSVNRDILKKKLQAVGICGDMFHWICDYLDERKQYAKVNGKFSSVDGIDFGVPQGSLLGPRLFSILVNDLPDAISAGHLYMYADDTTIYCVSKTIEDVIEKLNVAAKELHAWCTKNLLTVHTGKTEAMILSNASFVGPLQPVMFGNNMIKYVTESTSLGVKIDNKLNWKSNNNNNNNLYLYRIKLGQLAQKLLSVKVLLKLKVKEN